MRIFDVEILFRFEDMLTRVLFELVIAESPPTCELIIDATSPAVPEAGFAKRQR